MKTKLFLMILLIALMGCAKENDLKKSVMIYDEEYTDLPAYSEWGYNTFGAYYDRDVFISNNEEVPLKIISQNGGMQMLFSGQTNYNTWDPYGFMSMKITFDNFTPQSFTDLLILNDSILDFTSDSVHVEFVINGAVIDAHVIQGGMHVKRAQQLFVDDQLIEVILSGYFDFQMMVEDVPVSVSEGRFDCGVGQANFFKI